MNIGHALEQIGWGTYQTRVFLNTSFAILKCTVWMEITSMIMSEMEGTSVNTPILPLFLNFGSIVGNILLPYIAEKKGRSPAYKVSGAISLLGSLCLVVFGHPYILYLGLFGVGTGMGADMIICYTVLLESIPPSTSNRALTWTSTGWSLGTPLCILIAYLVKDVFKLEIMSWRVMVYFGLVCQLYFTIERIKINETPVYLFEKADSRFSNVLKNICDVNKTDKYLPLLEPSTATASSDQHFKYLTFFLSLEYFFTSFCYTTLFFIMPSLLPKMESGSEHMVMLLQQVSGFPGILIAGFSIRSLRDSVFWRTFSFCTAALLILTLQFDMEIWLVILITCVINYLLWTGLSLLYGYSQEIYCSSSRTIMNGILSGIGYTSGLAGNIILEKVIELYGKLMCLIIFSVAFLIAGICPPILHQLIS